MTIHVVGLLGGEPVGAAARKALASATLVAGGAEQLAVVADQVPPGVATAIVGAGLGVLDAVVAHDGDGDGDVCVLASGDPGFFGILRSLTKRVPAERLTVHPAPSSVAVAFARLALPWDGAVVASAHTGDAARAAAEVASASTAAVLCGPAAPPEAVGAALLACGAHHQVVAVATRLGEAGEVVHRLDGLAALAAGAFDHRSVVVLAHPEPRERARCSGGRPVAAFAHRAGMITKPEVRSVVLGLLDLPGRGVLWDVGAGSGSVAIEAALAAPGLRVVAIERDPAAADLVRSNALALGALVEVVVGEAPAALAGLPQPDRVFVGGGGLGVLDACRAACQWGRGGRIVASYAAVDRALAARDRLGSLVQVAVDRATDLPDGGVRFAADNPVFVAWGDVVADTSASTESRDAVVAVGIGCSSHATPAEVAELAESALASVPASVAASELEAIGGRLTPLLPRVGDGFAARVATIDRRRDHPAVRALVADWPRDERPVFTFPPELLGAVDAPNPSDVVAASVGTPSVAEAAALLAAGPGARLVVSKQRGPAATAAVAVGRPGRADTAGVIRVVGLGPGGVEHRTPAAAAAIRGADAVVGYGPYVDTASPLLRPEQFVAHFGMGGGAEAARAEAAVSLALAGWNVAVVSSGDPGVFAMASVTLEVAAAAGVDVEVVPGVTAAYAAAAAAGAPLAGPHAALTLSDLLLPWATIERQLRAAAGAGLALALYNPRSAGRPDHLARAQAALSEVLDDATPVVVVTDATGPHQDLITTTLAELDPTVAGMRSVVLVGGSDTVCPAPGRIVTQRHHPRPQVQDRGGQDRAGQDRRVEPHPIEPHPIEPHPIEVESYRILGSRVDLTRWPPLARAVVARVIHAAADIGYADTMVVDEDACQAGLDALRTGAPVIGDVEMVAVASRRAGTRCLLDEARRLATTRGDGKLDTSEPGLTVSAAAMRIAAERWPQGAVVVVGNAPTALAEVVRLAAAGLFQPALVIGMPVGFVGAAEAKEALRASGLPAISNVGERGGSAVAAAALNALWRLAQEGK